MSSLDEYVKEIARQLEIQVDPSAESVIEHIHNVCHSKKAHDEMKAYLKVYYMVQEFVQYAKERFFCV